MSGPRFGGRVRYLGYKVLINKIWAAVGNMGREELLEAEGPRSMAGDAMASNIPLPKGLGTIKAG